MEQDIKLPPHRFHKRRPNRCHADDKAQLHRQVHARQGRRPLILINRRLDRGEDSRLSNAGAEAAGCNIQSLPRGSVSVPCEEEEHV